MVKDLNMSPSVPALERGLAILERCANQPQPFAMLQRDLDIPKASLIRLLAFLRKAGYVERSSDGYVPGPALSRLPNHNDEQATLIRIGQPVLASLCEKTGNTAMLFAITSHGSIGLAKVAHEAAVIMRPIGSVNVNEWNTPWSWIAMAEHDRPVTADEYCDPPSRRQLAAIRRAIKHYRRDGWAYDDGIGIANVRRLAAPVRNRKGQLIAAIALGGNPLTMTDAHLNVFAQSLLSGCAIITKQL